MTPFDLIANNYDDSIVRGRIDYETLVDRISSFVKASPSTIADLASGTGNMANALHERWPEAHIVCEEPSLAMVKILQSKFPFFEVRRKSLQETEICLQELITVAFNSINYVIPRELPGVFERIRTGLKMGGIFYFDALTTESASQLLNGKQSLEKSDSRGDLAIERCLTSKKLVHIFTTKNGDVEHHTQHLVSHAQYMLFLQASHFEVLDIHQSKSHTLRTEYICKAC